MAAPPAKPASPQLILGADTTSLVNLTLASVPSPNTRRAYAKGIEDLTSFADGHPLTLTLLLKWRGAMSAALSPSTVNVRLSAARLLIRRAHRGGNLEAQQAWEMLEIAGVIFHGERIGNWLDAPQTDQLLAVPSGKDLRALRNRCILAVLAGCGLRAGELARLEVKSIQKRDGRWVIADLLFKRHLRSVGIPPWVKSDIDAWTRAAKIGDGRIIRQLTLKPEGLSAQGLWDIVHKAAAKIGIHNLGPHDLRRTCARLCIENGARLEDVQALLGHCSPVTTQRYVGTFKNFRDVPNDHLGLKRA